MRNERKEKKKECVASRKVEGLTDLKESESRVESSRKEEKDSRQVEMIGIQAEKYQNGLVGG